MVPSYFGFSTGGVPATAIANAVSPGVTKTVNVYWLGGDYQITSALNLSVGYYDVSTPGWAASGADASSGDISTVSALLDYSFSKRSDVYAGIAMNKYNGDYYGLAANSAISSTNSIYAVGIRHKF